MHFYGVYALARSAGIMPETVLTIAIASQFVDDSTEDLTNNKIVMFDNKALFPIMTSHILFDYKNALMSDQWNVLVPFHFLPGNEGDSFDEKMLCRKNSATARAVLSHALAPKYSAFWPHLIGIAAHAYAGIFSHFGFIGYADALE